MKRFSILVLLSVLMPITSSAQANDIRQEALNSLDTARVFIEKDNYKKAVEEINYALAKINELTAERLLQFIPDPPPGFTLLSKNSQGLGQGAAVIGNAGAQASFQGPSDESINLQISIGGITGQMGSLATLGSLFAGMSPQSSVKSIRLQGFTGTLQYDESLRKGNLTLQVGDKTSVILQGSNISDPEILKELVAGIDLTALATNY
jgi:hypothetical protein